MKFNELLNQIDLDKASEILLEHIEKGTIPKAKKWLINLIAEFQKIKSKPANNTILCGTHIENGKTIYDITQLITIDGEDFCAILSFVDWAEFIEAIVPDDTIKEFGAERIAVEIIWEMTFWAEDYKSLLKQIKKH